MCIIIPSIIGAACFQPVFRKLNNKGRTASIFALLTGISMLCMFFFNVKETPAAFYTLAGITQFFFSGFNTAIYAIIPDCVEYGEWKTGIRNDGFQYAFVSLGNKVKWEMVHYDVQIFGGEVLHQGKIAEMATGEGKTLVATLPVFLNALTGNGVHVVTVNDYLAKRDSEWMGPLYEFNGLSVDCIDKHQPNSEERRRAYQADITFGTNNEFGFDYLRDNMAMSPADLVQRQHNYAIVDEVDSVLIDDARTPLIISGPTPKGDDQMYEEYQPLVQKLYEVQRKQATEYLSDARRKIAQGLAETDAKQKAQILEEGFLSLYRSYKALPKNKALIKFLSKSG